MPRAARIKLLNGVYHVIIKGIKELTIFQDDKLKEKYLSLVKKYQEIFKFKVYGFCIMNTHAHFIIDSNGADISKFMKAINQSFAAYYNRKNCRYGPVFCGRFKSLLITDNNYLMNASMYIHNNPCSISQYQTKIEEYKYSSVLSYISSNFKGNPFVPVDTGLILNILSNDLKKSKVLYRDNLYQYCLNKSDKSVEEPEMELMNQKTQYISGKSCLIRNIIPENIIKFVSEAGNIDINYIKIKYKRDVSKLRAITVVFLRCLCDLKIEEIGGVLGNITSSNVSFLCNKGYNLINNDRIYANIYKKFIAEFSIK